MSVVQNMDLVSERDRYTRLMRAVECMCIEHIGEGSALRVNITARTKNASFEI